MDGGVILIWPPPFFKIYFTRKNKEGLALKCESYFTKHIQ